jgi:hypothetical protein
MVHQWIVRRCGNRRGLLSILERLTSDLPNYWLPETPRSRGFAALTLWID